MFTKGIEKKLETVAVETKDVVTESPEHKLMALLEKLGLHPELQEQKVNLPKDFSPVIFPSHEQIRLADQIRYPEGIHVNCDAIKAEHIANCLRQSLENYFVSFVTNWEFKLPIPEPIQLCMQIYSLKPTLFKIDKTVIEFQFKLGIYMSMWMLKNSKNPQASLNVPKQLFNAGLDANIWMNHPNFSSCAIHAKVWEAFAKLNHQQLAKSDPETFAKDKPAAKYADKIERPFIMEALKYNFIPLLKLCLEQGAKLDQANILMSIPTMSPDALQFLMTRNPDDFYHAIFSEQSVKKYIVKIIATKRVDLLETMFVILDKKLLELLKNVNSVDMMKDIMNASPQVLDLFLKHGLDPNKGVGNIYKSNPKPLLMYPMTSENMRDSQTRDDLSKKVKLLLAAKADPELELVEYHYEKQKTFNALSYFRKHCHVPLLTSWSFFTDPALTPEGKVYIQIERDLEQAMKHRSLEM